MNRINYGRQHIDYLDRRIVGDSLKSDLITTGKYVVRYENLLKKSLGSNFIVTCNSGTAGLHLAFHSVNLKKNDVIIMPSINFVASYSMAKNLGARIYLADVDPISGMLTPDKLINCIKKNKLKKIKVVVMMYMGGFPTNIIEFYNLKKKYNFKIIEDACHSFGASYVVNKKTFKVGSCKHADLSVFSTHPVKTFTTGEGGIVSTNNKVFFNKMNLLKSHGIRRKNNYWNYDISEIGYNYRLSDINCALGISQLNKINKFLKKRKKIYEQYYKSLNLFKNVIKFNQIDKNFPSYHLCIINIDFGKLKTNKDNFIRTLAKNNIFCQYHYIPLYNFSFYKKKISKKNFEGSEKYFMNSVSLPIFYDLKNLEIKKIINLTKKFISKKI